MKNFNQIFKIIVATAILIIAFAVAYYFVIVLPSQNQAELDFKKQQEEQRIEEKQEEKEEEERKEHEAEEAVEQKQADIDNCIMYALMDYESTWSNYCSVWKAEVDKAWTDCRNNIYSWQTDEENKQSCIRTAPDYNLDDRGICLLPVKYSEGIEGNLKEKKEECYIKYQ